LKWQDFSKERKNIADQVLARLVIFCTFILSSPYNADSNELVKFLAYNLQNLRMVLNKK